MWFISTNLPSTRKYRLMAAYQHDQMILVEATTKHKLKSHVILVFGFWIAWILFLPLKNFLQFYSKLSRIGAEILSNPWLLKSMSMLALKSVKNYLPRRKILIHTFSIVSTREALSSSKIVWHISGFRIRPTSLIHIAADLARFAWDSVTVQSVGADANPLFLPNDDSFWLSPI